MKIFLLLSLLFMTLFAQKDMLIISASMGKATQYSKMSSFALIAKKNNLQVDYLFENDIKESDQSRILKEYKIIMFDSLAGKREVANLLEKFSKSIDASDGKTIIFPSSITKEHPYRKNMSIKDNKALYEYWYNGGGMNFGNFSKYINVNILKRSNETIGNAFIIPEEGIYHPKFPSLVFKDLESYAKYFKIDLENHQPLIAIGMHRSSLSSENLEHINAMIKYIEDKGYQTLPYFTRVTGDDFVGEKFLRYKNKTIVDVLVNFQIMIIDHESLREKYAKLNIPILHALYYGEGSVEEWRKDRNGIAFPMIPMSYVIPETIGYIDALIVAAYDNVTKKLVPIKEQIAAMANKAMNLSVLRNKANKDKKVAIMFYNYPAGVSNMGAAFLNTPKSIALLMQNMKKAGYTTVTHDDTWFKNESLKTLKAYYEKGHDKQMLEDGSAALYPYEDYIKFFRALPYETQRSINKIWKSPRYSKMIVRVDNKKYFLIPRVKVGNVIVMPQPRRAERVDKMINKLKKLKDEDKKLWHDPIVPLSHSYLASYLYVRQTFKADALIHFGTHGTQEWMPGKERGLSVTDSPLLAIGDIPVIYPYITNNLAEAIQAKRRGRATIISHQTPPFGISGTYNELGEIMDLINQYRSVEDGMLKGNLKKDISDLCIKMNIHKDTEFSESDVNLKFDKFISTVEDFVLGMSGAAQPLGMHTFGTIAKKEFLITTLMQMMGKDFLVKADGKQYFAKDYKLIKESKAYIMVKEFIYENKSLDLLEDKEFISYLRIGLDYYNNFKNNQETQNLLRSLNAEYIKPGIGGDPIRNPASIPTGSNMYGFDPTKVPTKAAFKTGKKLMKDFVENYYNDNGKYPTKLTFNLWSLETMRHQGVLESQILAAMGLKPIWNETGISNTFVQNMAKQELQRYIGVTMATWFSKLVTMPRIEYALSFTKEDTLKVMKKMIRHASKTAKGTIEDVEIIPYSELKRPRIDVIISATGLYRDAFPQTMEVLAKAIKKISELKEENNHVYLNSLKIRKNLEAKNIDPEEALRLSSIRIFSNKTGAYNSGMEDVDQSGKWDGEDRLMENFFEDKGYYFGADKSKWNQKIDGVNLFAQNLSGTQSIIFSRTSNLYGLLTSDDPYQHFGSLSMAVRQLDGKSPKTYIANLRDPNGAKIQSTAEFMAQELRSRYFHPKWIQAMKDEGYSGTVGVLDVVKNFWGWQVVDPDVVRDDQWQEFVEVYIDDKYDMDLKEWFEENNPDSLAQITETMLEAARKGYWKTDDKTIKKLVKVYKDLEKDHNVKSFNMEFNKYLQNKAVGFGLANPLKSKGKKASQQSSKSVKSAKAAKLAKPAKPKIKGQKLEKVQQQIVKQDFSAIYSLLFLFCILFSGSYYGHKRDI